MTKDIENFTERAELLYRCAELFYVEGLKKREIAQQIHVSPTHVKRLLDEAIEKGIVEIEIKLAGRFRRLENALVKKLDLTFASVVETPAKYGIAKSNLGRAAEDEPWSASRLRICPGPPKGVRDDHLRLVADIQRRDVLLDHPGGRSVTFKESRENCSSTDRLKTHRPGPRK